MLNIATKINRGSVEILNDTLVLTTGDKVGGSEAALLQKMGIKPFTYGLELHLVVDNGNVYDPKVLDLTDDDMLKSFGNAAGNVAALSLALAIPNTASIPHMLANAYKNVLAVSVETDYTSLRHRRSRTFWPTRPPSWWQPPRQLRRQEELQLRPLRRSQKRRRKRRTWASTSSTKHPSPAPPSLHPPCTARAFAPAA